MNSTGVAQQIFMRFAPPIAALLLCAVFVSLGLWQLDRATQKAAAAAAFSDQGQYAAVGVGQPVKALQRFSSYGHYLPNRQFLIDKMIVGGRAGYFVITPFEFESDGPLLLVNRGWLQKPVDRSELPGLELSAKEITVFGLAGKLPRVSIRPEPALSGEDHWPRVAVYPTLAELEAELGREVLPFVLLLNPEHDSAFVRRWQPAGSGPMMHYGYAVQWFVMAAAVLFIFVWQLRKKARQNTELG